MDFLGGYSALVQKGFSKGDELLLRSIPQALAQGCDTFVTSDLRYNDFLDTRGLNLIDAGHFPTEDVVCPEVMHRLQKAFPAICVSKSAVHRDAVQYYMIEGE